MWGTGGEKRFNKSRSAIYAWCAHNFLVRRPTLRRRLHMHDLVMTNSSGNLVLGVATVRADDTWDVHDCMFGPIKCSQLQMLLHDSTVGRKPMR